MFATLFSAQDLGVKISSGLWANAPPLLENSGGAVRAAGFGLVHPHPDDYSNLLHVDGRGDPVDRLIYVTVGFIVVRPLSPAQAPAARPDTHGVASPSPGGERW